MSQIRNEKLYSVLLLSITASIKEEADHLAGGKVVTRSDSQSLPVNRPLSPPLLQGKWGGISSSAQTFEII